MCTLYLGFPFYLVQRKQVVLQKGEPLRATAPLSEPQESYRGIYLPVQLPEEAEVSFPVRRGQTVFVEVKQHEQTLAIKAVTRRRPDTDTYLRADVRYVQDSLVFLNFPASAKKVFLTPREAARWESVYYEEAEPPTLSGKNLPVAIYVYRGRGIADHILAPGAER